MTSRRAFLKTGAALPAVQNTRNRVAHAASVKDSADDATRR